MPNLSDPDHAPAKPETCRQPLVLAEVPAVARYLVLHLRPGRDARASLRRVREIPIGQACVGFGAPFTLALGATVPGVRTFRGLSGPGCTFPSTQGALFLSVAAADPTELHDRSTTILARLRDDFAVDEDVTAFRYREGRDLTGYVDGTENPRAEGAVAAAIASGRGEGIDGSSYVAVQRWIHELDRFASLPVESRDAIIGRRIDTNEEIADAPASSHVKRSAQESFPGGAFMVRRSMPYRHGAEQGLFFVAFGESLDRFERVLTRMAGLDDGIVDSLMLFSRAVSGGYYWCPPVADGALDLRAVS